MSALAFTRHFLKRKQERNIDVSKQEVLAQQGDLLRELHEKTLPMLTDTKLLAFRRGGQRFSATRNSITTTVTYDGVTYVLGIGGQTFGTAHVVTAWKN